MDSRGAASSCAELQYSDAMRRLVNRSCKREERAAGLLPRNKDSLFGDFPPGSRPVRDAGAAHTAGIIPKTRFNNRECAALALENGSL